MTAATLPHGSVVIATLPNGSVTVMPAGLVPQMPVEIIAAFSAVAELSLTTVNGEAHGAVFQTSGTLGVAVSAIATAVASMGAHGGLVAVTAVAAPLAASASGTLTVLAGAGVQPAFSAEASLSADVYAALAATAAFTSTGGLSATQMPLAAVDGPLLSTEATLSFDIVADGGTEILPAPIAAEATLSFDGGVHGEASSTAEATLSAIVLAQFARAAQFTSGGVLSASATQIDIRTLGATATGNLSVKAAPRVVAGFTGSGTLTATVEALMLVRQRMVKNGNQAMSGARAIVPNWTSDGTYPATISSNKLVVQGGGAATIATQNLSPSGNGGGGNRSRIYLMHNGTAIATYERNGSAGWSCPNWSIPRTVAAGDTIWIETQFDPFGAVTIVNNSFVEVIPT